MEEPILLAIQASKGALGPGVTSKMALFLGLSRIIVRDLFDFLELFHQARLTYFHSLLMHSTMKQRYKRQCENAIEGVYTKHLVCPVAGRWESPGNFKNGSCTDETD